MVHPSHSSSSSYYPVSPEPQTMDIRPEKFERTLVLEKHRISLDGIVSAMVVAKTVDVFFPGWCYCDRDRLRVRYTDEVREFTFKSNAAAHEALHALKQARSQNTTTEITRRPSNSAKHVHFEELI